MRKFSADLNSDGTAWIRAVPLYSGAGTLTARTGTHRVYNDSGAALRIVNARASVGTAPAGASIVVDIRVDGTSIYGTPSNRPTIAAAGNTSGKNVGMSTTAWPDGSYVTVDIVSVGSSTPGSDLTVQLAVA
ncbi:hypothetical protein [Streptosporangium sp. NPDC002524]|uniref:hypothetical protein n=1 Tax=Streptosporangium sp. NPDC002524 TaxID=3154537 RepID=UPI003323D049